MCQLEIVILHRFYAFQRSCKCCSPKPSFFTSSPPFSLRFFLCRLLAFGFSARFCGLDSGTATSSIHSPSVILALTIRPRSISASSKVVLGYFRPFRLPASQRCLDLVPESTRNTRPSSRSLRRLLQSSTSIFSASATLSSSIAPRTSRSACVCICR